MGGKKKKGMSNRLAKMNDEERARYLQHRAQLEEEAKRRKEQLVATYMKNKIKREDGFTRLNIAKINEYWHQILRRVKCKQLKTEIEDLSTWITKVVELKNNTIKRLMVEIEEAEKQYQTNFEAHISHIGNFTGVHKERQEALKKNFAEHADGILANAENEMERLKDSAEKEREYLKTVLFAIQETFENDHRQIMERRESRLEDYNNMLQSNLKSMVTSYDASMNKIWHGINRTLRDYLGHTATKRHHFIDLKCLDDRNIAERTENEKRIAERTAQKESLAQEYASIFEKHEAIVNRLADEQRQLAARFAVLRKRLAAANRRDDARLTGMTAASNAAIAALGKIKARGENVKQMAVCCRRLETEEEKLISYAISRKNFQEFDILEELVETIELETEPQKDGRTSTPRIVIKNVDGDTIEDITDERPKAILETQPGFSETCDAVSKLDGLIWCYNRVELDCMELKAEKTELANENRRLKEMIRGILEEAALESSTPDQNTKYLRPKLTSAPASFKSQDTWKSQVPNCVVLEF